jgi:hypothetical protein
MADDTLIKKKKGNPLNTSQMDDPSPLTGSTDDVDALAVPTEDELLRRIANRPPAFPVREQPSLTRYDGSEDRKAADERLSKSEDMAAWGDLATRLGNAIVKYSAANEGLKSGVDLSGIKTDGPDFKQFLDTAGRRYKSSLEDVAGKERKSQSELDAEDRRLQQKFSDDVAKYGIDDATDKYLLNTIQKQRAEEAASKARGEDKAWDREKFYAAQKLQRQALAQRAERPEKEARPDYTILKERLDANASNLKQAQGQLQAAGTLAEMIRRYPDLSKKGKEAADKEISELTGKAGLSATDVAEITKQVDDSRGGWFSSEKPEAIKEALDKLAARQRGEVQRLSQEQRQLLGGISPALPSSSVESKVEEAPRTLSPEDQAALDWARKNPSDSRAAAILARLQSK